MPRTIRKDLTSKERTITFSMDEVMFISLILCRAIDEEQWNTNYSEAEYKERATKAFNRFECALSAYEED